MAEESGVPDEELGRREDPIRAAQEDKLSSILEDDYHAGTTKKTFFEAAFGKGFESAINLKGTRERIADALAIDREDSPPNAINPWEVRIGGSTFFVPPVHINVNQQFKSGSLTGSALRQTTTPKFNAGHSETIVTMTLYFPTTETIFGTEDSLFDINFDEDKDEKIDRFLSSLRGLIAQFRYMPFLPIRNDYLNKVYGITGVAMKDMTISTVPNFPFCMAVTLTMCKFNHKVYLPMIEHFDQAIHWGRYRSFAGRAAIRMAQWVKPLKVFSDLDQVHPVDDPATSDPGKIDFPIKSASDILDDWGNEDVGGRWTFNTPTHETVADATKFKFFYPFHTPAKLAIPDLDDLRPPDPQVEVRKKSWWERLLGSLGVDVSIYPEAEYSKARDVAESMGTGYYRNTDEDKLLANFLKTSGLLYTEMGPDKLNSYISRRLRELDIPQGTDAASELELRITEIWFLVLFKAMLEDPMMASALANESRRNRQLTIDEWEVPLVELDLDYRYITVEGVAISMGNSLAKVQLQMQDEPSYQHIGGKDTRIDISFIVHGEEGEEQLRKLRNMFDTITGLARLSHNHGVLGFLGVKNLIAELVGVRYVVPLNFTIDTVPNVPHAYQVELSLVDFDIFQQRREQLTAEQQAELVEAFGKANPFLRIKQLDGHFSLYPDFPLAVRDDEGKIVGHLDPDYYYRGFKAIDDDTVSSRYDRVRHDQQPDRSVGDILESFEDGQRNRQDREDETELINVAEAMRPGGVTVNFGKVDGEVQMVRIEEGKYEFYSGSNKIGETKPPQELHAGIIDRPYVEGLTPPSGYVEPLPGGGTDHDMQFSMMMKDMQYRDKSGRMVRAFPTYMLWLIDEGGVLGGIRLFDNFYGLQSVLDMSIVQSEDIMADTLILRLSNIYSKLTTDFSLLLEEDDPSARIINEFTRRSTRLLTGGAEYMLELQTLRLKPGTRIHLRMGYGSSPSAMETVFNGTVMEVQQGEIVTVLAQSDAQELGQLVNNTNNRTHSGKIDGALTGFYMSEPRDLMTALLTQGSTTMREMVAHATLGQVFSENRYGIRHFGTILYDYMDLEEKGRSDLQRKTLRDRTIESVERNEGGMTRMFFDVSMSTLLHDAWANMATHRDYEVFKRNIYPGNGMGVGQFLGGDLGDLFVTLGADGRSAVVDGAGVGENGQLQTTDPLTGNPISDVDVRPLDNSRDSDDPHYNSDSYRTEDLVNKTSTSPASPPNLALAVATGAVAGAWLGPAGVIGGAVIGTGVGVATNLALSPDLRNNLLEQFGIRKRYDDDEYMPEVTFRAQTYMKTVWDLFKICAAMQPDYIVAVRPFEGRSTVFYGKPHWLYTSGVIPVSKGVKPADAPPPVPPDEEFGRIFKEIEDLYDRREEQFADNLLGAVRHTTADPAGTHSGLEFDGTKESVLSLPTSLSSGASLPRSEGAVGLEMHLPTSDNLEQDIVQHKQLADLPERYRHPFYMDRKDGGRGGYVGTNAYRPDRNLLDQTILAGENPDDPGQPGALGVLTPEVEMYYLNQRWTGPDGTSSGWRGVWEGKKILIYCPRTNKAVVGTPGEYGPAEFVVRDQGVVGGCSPDLWWLLGAPSRTDNCIWRIMPDDYPLGPVSNINHGTGNESRKLEEILVDGDVSTSTGDAELPSWAEGYTNSPNEEELNRVSQEQGWRVADIPVNFTKQQEIEQVQYDENGKAIDGTSYTKKVDVYVDVVGKQASEAYLDVRSEEDANKIWRELRIFFADDSDPQNVFIEFLRRNNITPEVEVNNDMEVIKRGPDSETDSLYDKFMDNFIQFLWRDPANRGWVVRVSSKNSSLLDIGGVDLSNIGLDENRDWSLAHVTEAWGAYLRGATVPGPDADAVGNEEAAKSWMDANQEPGYTNANPIGKAVEGIGRRVHDVGSELGNLKEGVWSIAGGLLNFMRLSLLQLSRGMMMVDSRQKNSNILNAVYNDSIYYQQGISDGKVQNALLFLTDNPFTREYGEPVVEIREPFQRLHLMNSFRHIINNGITESLNGVATVVTATTNNADPVTVHFDKGTSSERQIEKTVDTGLYYDDPSLWSWINPLSWDDRVADIAAGQNFQNIRQFPFGDQFSGKADPHSLNAKRIALWHLKESLKDIYQGEIVVIGDASIRPHDMIWLNDVYEGISGPVEVEQVVHQFSPETGFITSITPNAMVTIQDPSRFYLAAEKRHKAGIQAVRDRLREELNVRSDTGGLVSTDGSGDLLDVDLLVARVEEDLKNNVQFYGGKANAIKNITYGSIAGGLAVAGASIPIAVLFAGGGILAWKGWSWVRDNLIDQHGCNIAYLTKNGQPMDAGISYNQGVAVGQQRGLDVVLGGLKVGSIPTVAPDGSTKIRYSDVIPQLKWDEYGPSEYAAEIDMFTNLTIQGLKDVSGRDGGTLAAAGFYEVYWVRITNVVDADTFDTEMLGMTKFDQFLPVTSGLSIGRLRLAGVQAVEDRFKNDELMSTIHVDQIGVRATQYARSLLEGNEVAVRVLSAQRTERDRDDNRGRTLGYVFHNAPETVTTEAERRNYLLSAAGSIPLKAWNSYTSDGKPSTFDWDLVVKGYADVAEFNLERSIPGRGVHGDAIEVDNPGGNTGRGGFQS